MITPVINWVEEEKASSIPMRGNIYSNYAFVVKQSSLNHYPCVCNTMIMFKTHENQCTENTVGKIVSWYIMLTYGAISCTLARFKRLKPKLTKSKI